MAFHRPRDYLHIGSGNRSQQLHLSPSNIQNLNKKMGLACYVCDLVFSIIINCQFCKHGDYGHLINCKVAEMCWRGWQTWQGASGSCTYSPLPVCPFTQGSNISISKTLQITQLSFSADKAHCWLIFNLPPTQTHRSLSVELLSSLLSPNFDVKPRFPQPRCRIQHSGGTCFPSKLLKESVTD